MKSDGSDPAASLSKLKLCFSPLTAVTLVPSGSQPALAPADPLVPPLPPASPDDGEVPPELTLPPAPPLAAPPVATAPPLPLEDEESSPPQAVSVVSAMPMAKQKQGA